MSLDYSETLKTIENAIPRWVRRRERADLCQDVFVAILSGEIGTDQISKTTAKFARCYWSSTVSLDEPMEGTSPSGEPYAVSRRERIAFDPTRPPVARSKRLDYLRHGPGYAHAAKLRRRNLAARWWASQTRTVDLDELLGFVVIGRNELRPLLEPHSGFITIGRTEALWNFAVAMMLGHVTTWIQGMILSTPQRTGYYSAEPSPEAHFCGLHHCAQASALSSFFGRLYRHPELTARVPGFDAYVRKMITHDDMGRRPSVRTTVHQRRLT